MVPIIADGTGVDSDGLANGQKPVSAVILSADLQAGGDDMRLAPFPSGSTPAGGAGAEHPRGHPLGSGLGAARPAPVAKMRAALSAGACTRGSAGQLRSGRT